MRSGRCGSVFWSLSGKVPHFGYRSMTGMIKMKLPFDSVAERSRSESTSATLSDREVAAFIHELTPPCLCLYHSFGVGRGQCGSPGWTKYHRQGCQPLIKTSIQNRNPNGVG